MATLDERLRLTESRELRASLSPGDGAAVDRMQAAIAELWTNAGLLAGHYEALSAFVALRAVEDQLTGTYRAGQASDEAAVVTATCVELVRMALVDLVPSG
jgi:hypothetical protein